ncbi:hypothetical protein C5167_004165 [Papaver somniferum]|nr:hypothetical protein C5167_004165 [Papaver somniferum]
MSLSTIEEGDEAEKLLLPEPERGKNAFALGWSYEPATKENGEISTSRVVFDEIEVESLRRRAKIVVL